MINYKILPQLGLSDGLKSHLRILFVDTCSLLDILRLPYKAGQRQSSYYQPEDYDALQNLAADIKAGRILLLCSTLSIEEINDNKVSVDNLLAEFQNKLSIAFPLFAHISGTSIATNIKQLVDDDLRQIYETMRSNAYYIGQTDAVLQSAFQRVINNQLPARKNKKDIKDCLIWETFLTIQEILAHSDRLVFLTSNTKDFAKMEEGTTSTLIDELSAPISILAHNYLEAVDFLRVE